MGVNSGYRPNFGLYMVVGFLLVLAIALNFAYVPAGESLFNVPILYDWLMLCVAGIGVSMYLQASSLTLEDLKSRAIYGFSAFAAVYVMVSVFCTTKSLIHVVNPHLWDEALLHIEALIHGGVMPSVLLAKMITFEPLIVFFDVLYTVWFLVMMGYSLFVIFSAPYSHLRERYLFCFAVAWVFLGLVCAVLFASVGPIFLSHFLSDDTASVAAREVMGVADAFSAHTKDMGLPQAYFRDLLLGYLSNGQVVNLNTPSAMPSMHVAVVSLIACHARHVNKWLFWAALCYAGCILVGSVLLQWHYALDGYFSILAVLGLWRLSAYLPAPRRKS